MKLQDDIRDSENNSEKESFRKRSKASQRRRKKQLRTQMILINSAIALIIILIVMVGEVVSLNKGAYTESGAVEADKDTNRKSEDSGDSESTKKAQAEEAPAETEAPQESAAPDGQQRWIRTDLDKDKPMVALTFDDGPYTPVTSKILKVLKANDARATFFCVANRIPAYSDVVEQAYEQGCQIASHTYGHVYLTGIKKKQIKYQVDKANSAIEKVIGCKASALRPPGGMVDSKVKSTVGMPMICWSIDSEDWRSRNSKKIFKRCKSIQDGDIVLMHDLYQATASTVKKLVPYLQKKGFLLVTVDELFYYKGIELEDGQVYYSAK
ncbi:MAG: polysaccharide deacetylase family protein [Clostridiaceae bacterium]|nr:polysaccharide deacetylase family protein [Clostridiaceae bacterium]